MKSCAILSSIASVLILSLSVSMLAPSSSLPDCSKWLSNSKILPYDSENSQSIHTFITESGTMYANPEYVNKDACTRALHMHIDTLPERRRLLDKDTIRHGISSTIVFCDAANLNSFSKEYTDSCVYKKVGYGENDCVSSKVLECKRGTQIGIDGATQVPPYFMISGSYAHKCLGGWSAKPAATKTCS